MKKLLILFLFIVMHSFAQKEDLHIPLNIQQAIENGTRSLTGEPGRKYWQNKSVYNIRAEIVEDSSLLIGEENIVYYNNSPDSLRRIVVRLYQDISKVGAVRDWYVGKNNLNSGVTLNYFIIDGDTLDVGERSREIIRGSTNAIVVLKKVLAPGSSISIDVGWKFEIPQKLKIRMGNYGNGNFYVAYWYPQIAVYDDIDGWDVVDYAGSVEFYNDFSDYNVNIKVPQGMVVWATGDLTNAENVLRTDIYEKYELAKKSDETIRIIEQKDFEEGTVTAENDFNVWKFNAINVTDFTFATSRTYNWDGASVVVDKTTGRRSLTDVVYKDSTIHYDEGAQYARETIRYLSEELPGFPYPYSHATSYCNGNRGGGMESPMMANDGAPASRAGHIGLIFHEIAHNYFPFIMGTNERKYAWMDEGWASFLPRETVDSYEPEYDYWKNRVTSYEDDAGKESDLPLVTPSYSYKTRGMRLGFYDRPALAYNALKDLLGRELFKKAILEYMNRWNGKHPIPIDFFFTVNDVVGEDLSWFWKPWFYEFGYPDLAIKDVKSNNGEININVEMLGNIPTKVLVQIEFADGSTETIEKPVTVWKNGEKNIGLNVKTDKKLKLVILGNKYIPDVVKDNNIYTNEN